MSILARSPLIAPTNSKNSLWHFQFGWDVLVKCTGATWRLHRQVLEAASPWFSKRLLPHDPSKHYVEFSCDGHDSHTLGHALWFMYHGFYEGGAVLPNDPLDGDCIRKNIYMYLSGASVDCGAMMSFAVAAMEGITEIFTDRKSVV